MKRLFAVLVAVALLLGSANAASATSLGGRNSIARSVVVATAESHTSVTVAANPLKLSASASAPATDTVGQSGWAICAACILGAIGLTFAFGFLFIAWCAVFWDLCGTVALVCATECASWLGGS